MGSTPIRATERIKDRDVGQWQARVPWEHDRVGSIPAIPIEYFSFATALRSVAS
jgi:hypothetical protein